MSSAIVRELDRTKRLFRHHGFLLELGAGVSAGELAEAERITGLSFGNALGELFSVANGSFGKTCFALHTDQLTACSLASLEEALGWWSEWLPYGADQDQQFGPTESGRDPRIHPEKYINRKWFPFAEFNAWATTAYFDADPGALGNSGQVIAYQHDPDAMHFIADDIAAFISRSNDLLEAHARELLFVDGEPSIFSPRRA